jgi:hypothetical protein
MPIGVKVGVIHENISSHACEYKLSVGLIGALSGCYFHFNESLWRHIQQIGLARDYQQDCRLNKVIRRVMAIGFLPTLLVRQNFLLLRNSRRVQRLINTYPTLDEWLEYVQTTYIDQDSHFPPAIWNVYDRKCDTRTNNHLAGKKQMQ